MHNTRLITHGPSTHRCLCRRLWQILQLSLHSACPTGSWNDILQDHVRARELGTCKKMTTPGVEPGLSRPQRDVLTTRRCGRLISSWRTPWLTLCGVSILYGGLHEGACIGDVVCAFAILFIIRGARLHRWKFPFYLVWLCNCALAVVGRLHRLALRRHGFRFTLHKLLSHDTLC